jgi:hypothetical protein
MTEAERAANAVALAREVIDKYGADADKPSVKLAIALISGAHARDALRADLKDADQHAMDQYTRGVMDGSEININILEESKADLEEQRQEIGRLRAEVDRLNQKVARYDEAATFHENNWLKVAAELDAVRIERDKLQVAFDDAWASMKEERKAKEAAWLQIKEMQER